MTQKQFSKILKKDIKDIVQAHTFDVVTKKLMKIMKNEVEGRLQSFNIFKYKVVIKQIDTNIEGTITYQVSKDDEPWALDFTINGAIA